MRNQHDPKAPLFVIHRRQRQRRPVEGDIALLHEVGHHGGGGLGELESEAKGVAVGDEGGDEGGGVYVALGVRC
jgi:hypothetical protein